ncbi:MAG: retinol dehydrogenase [Halioglobus sp.]|nr:retinol dehydrogenase [Halioglobus sp.]
MSMDKTLTLDEQIEVDRPLREVYAYIAEFSRIQEWDPGVARGVKLTPGSPAVGSEYRIDMKAGFSLHYRIVELEPCARMRMEVDSKVFTAREEIRFAALKGGGTRVRYIAEFTFPAPLAAANKAYPAAMERVGKSTMRGLQAALEDDFDAPEQSALVALSDRLVLPGIWRFTRLGYKASRRHWKPVSAYLGDSHVVITGATSGLGLAAAQGLADMGARLTLVARDADKAAAVAADIARQSGNASIAVEICDLSIMAQVHALAERLLQAGEPVHALVNNAGALFNPRQLTSEGFEASFALLLLGPYILTERLQPLLAQAGDARVVNVLSGGMYSQKIRVRDLQSERGEYSGAVAYARAKRGLMILTEEWAQAWADAGIVVNAMHPGWADTPGVESSLPGFYRLTRPLLRSPEEGADTAVWLAASTEAGKVSGEFWLDREIHPSHLSGRTRETPEERAQLLQVLEELRQSTAVKPAASGPRGKKARRS